MTRLALILALCISHQTYAGIGDKPSTSNGWTAEELTGCTIRLVDDQKIRVYYFGDEGFVTATLGWKNGLVFGPIYSWHLGRDGIIVISETAEEKTRVIDRMKKIRTVRDKVEVDRSGNRETYTLTKPKKSN